MQTLTMNALFLAIAARNAALSAEASPCVHCMHSAPGGATAAKGWSMPEFTALNARLVLCSFFFGA